MLMERLEKSLVKFGFDDAQRKNLKVAGGLVTPILDSLIENFYARALEDPESRPFFSDPAVLAHAKDAQRAHWARLLSGEFDRAYADGAERIGQVHFGIKLPFDIYQSAYAKMTSEIYQRLISGKLKGSRRLNPARKAALIGALNCAFALDSERILASHFRAMREEQTCAFDHIQKGVEEIAQKNVAYRIPSPEESDFPPSFDALRLSFNDLGERLCSIFRRFGETTQTLNDRSQSVADGALELSQRTENQAATLEQTVAAMQNISSNTKRAKDGAALASELVNATAVKAQASGDVVLNAVSKMKEIESSSEKIGQIIGVIDDIAFQTNLLALNAGVEAARAGEAGRGFAVVASEVRALAQRASSSAKEINALIGVSAHQVSDGVTLVGEAGEALQAISGSISDMMDTVNNVADAATEQARALGEVNVAMSQLDSVTQSNAAMVEETSAAMKSISGNTHGLAQLISDFNLTPTSGSMDLFDDVA